MLHIYREHLASLATGHHRSDVLIQRRLVIEFVPSFSFQVACASEQSVVTVSQHTYCVTTTTAKRELFSEPCSRKDKFPYLFQILKYYTGRFIVFSMITNIHNNKTKGPTLMELFTATGKLKKSFF